MNEHPVVDVVNHAISTSGGVVCQPVSTQRADIWSVIYDCYSRNDNVKMATVNVITGEDFFSSLLL